MVCCCGALNLLHLRLGKSGICGRPLCGLIAKLRMSRPDVPYKYVHVCMGQSAFDLFTRFCLLSKACLTFSPTLRRRDPERRRKRENLKNSHTVQLLLLLLSVFVKEGEENWQKIVQKTNDDVKNTRIFTSTLFRHRHHQQRSSQSRSVGRSVSNNQTWPSLQMAYHMTTCIAADSWLNERTTAVTFGALFESRSTEMISG